MAELGKYTEGSLDGIVQIAMQDEDPTYLLDLLVTFLGREAQDGEGDGLMLLADYLARPDKLAAPGRFPALSEELVRQHRERIAEEATEEPITTRLVALGAQAIARQEGAAPEITAAAEALSRVVVMAVLNEILTGGKPRVGSDEEGYELIRDLVNDRLNPRDDDASETHIVMEAIEGAAEFVEGQPCLCTPEMIEDHDACKRCRVLGRLGDEPVAR